MWYYIIAWICIIGLAIAGYHYVQNVKDQAYVDGFNDGWREREELSVQARARVDILDLM